MMFLRPITEVEREVIRIAHWIDATFPDLNTRLKMSELQGFAEYVLDRVKSPAQEEPK